MDLQNIIKIPKVVKFQAPKPIKRQFSHSRHIKVKANERCMSRMHCLYLGVILIGGAAICFVSTKLIGWILSLGGTPSENTSWPPTREPRQCCNGNEPFLLRLYILKSSRNWYNYWTKRQRVVHNLSASSFSACIRRKSRQLERRQQKLHSNKKQKQTTTATANSFCLETFHGSLNLLGMS